MEAGTGGRADTGKVTGKEGAEPSVVDVLLGRHRHEPLLKTTLGQRPYANSHLHKPSFDAEVTTAGRHRNRPELEWDAERVARQLAKERL
jgi:hypothetical protein